MNRQTRGKDDGHDRESKPRRRLLRPWRVLKECELYSFTPFFQVFQQQVELPNGRVIDDYHRIQFPNYVTVVARTIDRRFIMVRKYNHGFRKTCMLFPGGLVNPGESPRKAAVRELLEETGYVAHRWSCLGRFMPHANYGCGSVNLFLGEDCRCKQPPASGDLEEMEIILLSERELVQYMRSGRNPSHAAMTAFLLSFEKLGRNAQLSQTRPPA